MTTWASACSPPAPMPCTARQPMSQLIDCGQPGHRRTDHEDHDRDLDQQLLVEQVGELAPDRGGRRGGQQGRRDHPGVLGLRAVQVRDDRRQGVGDDRRGQDRDEHREQEAAERLQDLAPAARRLRVGRGPGAVAGAGRSAVVVMTGTSSTVWSRGSSRCGDPRACVRWSSSSASAWTRRVAARTSSSGWWARASRSQVRRVSAASASSSRPAGVSWTRPARRSAGSRRRTTSPRASSSPTCLLTTDWQTPRRAASSPSRSSPSPRSRASSRSGSALATGCRRACR